MDKGYVRGWERTAVTIRTLNHTLHKFTSSTPIKTAKCGRPFVTPFTSAKLEGERPFPLHQ
ncbi:MAG: hypothetical protein IPM76_18555 [Chloroflexi bacterium]|nr:hypothetical protein [Chloroflexota bacterium]